MVVEMQIRIVNNANTVILSREDAVKLRDALNAMFPLAASSGGYVLHERRRYRHDFRHGAGTNPGTPIKIRTKKVKR